MSSDKMNQQQEAYFVQNQAETPKSSVGIFDLPTGYLTADGELITEVQVKEITGVEEDMLAAPSIPAGKKVTQLLANCLMRVGGIADPPSLVNAARGMVTGDRVFLMLAIRRVTLGDDFPFQAQCTECNHKHLAVVNLAELEIKPSKDPMKRVWDNTLPVSKKAVRWHVMTGKEEEALSRVSASSKNDQLSLGIAARLDMLGEQPSNLEAVKALGLGDRNFLRERFDEVEGGVETEVELACPNCGEEFKQDLDVSQSGFFFPSRIQKTSKRNTSSF